MQACGKVRAWALAAAVIASSPAQIRAQEEGWVEDFSALRMRPGLGDARASLAERLALARTLGRHGPAHDAVHTLLAGLERDPAGALRDELLLSLARRAAPAAREPLRELLAGKQAGTASLALALAASPDARTIDALVRALPRKESARVAEEALLRVGAAAAPRLAAALATPQLAPHAARVLDGLGPRARAARVALERALRADSAAVRAAAASALGRIGERASARALAARLDDQPAVVHAALAALVRVATAAEAPALAELLARSQGEQRAFALHALAVADPVRAVPALQRALREGDAAEQRAALDVLEGERPHPSWSGLLAARVRDQRSEAAASALARIAGGAGLPALLRAARARAPHRDGGSAARASADSPAERSASEVAARALAIGLRRFGDDLDDDVREDALVLLRALPAGERQLVLRALARDSELGDELVAALRARDAGLRASAATSARMLGDDELAAPVRAALLRERDVEAIRRLCDAARALGVRFTWPELQRWLHDPETSPEAAALAAASLAEQPPVELRSALRRMARPGRAGRLRVAAALALAALGDDSAWPALAAMLDDPAARVRLAAVHALSRLPHPEARRALQSHTRIERDALVREAALRALGDSDALAMGGAADGGARVDVLEARVRTDAGAQGAERERALLDVLLDDGRWLRIRTLPGGELVLEDLAPGVADVRAAP